MALSRDLYYLLVEDVSDTLITHTRGLVERTIFTFTSTPSVRSLSVCVCDSIYISRIFSPRIYRPEMDVRLVTLNKRHRACGCVWVTKYFFLMCMCSRHQSLSYTRVLITLVSFAFAFCIFKRAYY